MLFLAVILAASGPNPFLAQARVHYQALDYSRCLKRLAQAELWKSTLDEEAEVALYRGLCQFGQGHQEQAESDLELALKISPAATLPPYSSPRLKELFAKARERVGVPDKPLEPPLRSDAPTQEPPVTVAPSAPAASAPVTTAVAPAPLPHRSRSIGPYLAGGVGVLGLSAGIGLGLHARQLEQDSFHTTFEADTRGAALGARSYAAYANVGYGVAAASALTAGTLFLIDWLGQR